MTAEARFFYRETQIRYTVERHQQPYVHSIRMNARDLTVYLVVGICGLFLFEFPQGEGRYYCDGNLFIRMDQRDSSFQRGLQVLRIRPRFPLILLLYTMFQKASNSVV